VALGERAFVENGTSTLAREFFPAKAAGYLRKQSVAREKRSAGRGQLRDRDIELLKVHWLGQMLAEASRLASGDILLRPEPGERERGYVAKLAHLCEQIEPGAIRQRDIAD